MAEAITLRPYQQASVDAVYDHLRTRDDNPCVVIPTAGGKTPIMATLCRDAVQLWDGRVLILAHVKELLEQAADKLHVMAPDLWHQIGVYSAGLKSRDIDKAIIVAGIQSVYKRAAELDRFDLILIDEAHLIPPGNSGGGDGMYRKFLADAKVVNPNVRVIGLTATPYRMTTGTICAPPPDGLLNHICYEVGVRELIVQGYLCPPTSKSGRRKVNTSNLHIRGGEFVAREVEAVMDDDDLVRSACREIAGCTKNRNTVLIFAAGVNHALHVQRVLEEMGHECGFVCGDTLPFERTKTLERFKGGDLKYLVNVNVLTTGFDAPNIDCVAMLRPTNSPGLYYQMVGRGFRLHPSKQDCLILDFGGNTVRHGPVDALQVEDKASTGTGDAPAKECPQCQTIIPAGYSICPECGHQFPPPESQRHGAQADNHGVLSGQVTDTDYDVESVYYSVHTKRGADEFAPKTMRADYQVDFNETQSEWVCPEHTGFARQKFEAWWRARSREPLPNTAAEAVDICEQGGIADTRRITVRSVAGERFDRIVNYDLGDTPARLDGSDERDEGLAPVMVGKADYTNIDESDLPF